MLLKVRLDGEPADGELLQVHAVAHHVDYKLFLSHFPVWQLAEQLPQMILLHC
jgi:hypothetical protein